MCIYIGLDVHSKQTVYAIQDGEGTLLAQGSVETTVEGVGEMLAKHNVPEATRVALESGSQSYWMSHVLSAAGMEPVVIDAREVRALAKRIGQKSDKRDAREICDGLRRDIYTSIVWTPPAEVQRLREILSRRRHFVQLRTAEVNAAKFLLRARGLRIAKTKRFVLKSERAWKELLAKEEAGPVRAYLEWHMRTWLLADSAVAALERELQEALGPFRETIDLLMTAPGVGPITAATYVAVIGDPRRFETSNHVVSYVGLAPSTYDSGERERHGAITKRGSTELRSALVEAAHHASRPYHPLYPYFTRVMVKSGYKKAVVAVAHRLARILYRMWLRGEKFNVRHLNVELGPHTTSKTVLFRIKPKRAA